MKKLISFLLAALMVFSLCACSSSNDDTKESGPATSETVDYSAMTLDELKAELTTISEGKLIMSTNAQFPPYESVADDGQGYEGTGYEGIDVELAYAIAQKLGLELQIDDMDFDGALAAVQSGKSDMVMAGLTVNEDRLKNMDFTDSYSNGVQVVIVPEGSDIASVDDLADKQIGTQRGTTGYQYCVDDYGEDAVVAFDDGATAVQNLLAGKVDCVVIDSNPAKEYVKANAGLTILDTEYTNEDYAIAVNKGNEVLLAALNKALDELQADGTVDSIVNKYISAD